jgi:hypothetical protein
VLNVPPLPKVGLSDLVSASGDLQGPSIDNALVSDGITSIGEGRITDD